MIHHDAQSRDGEGIVLVFDTNNPGEVEAIHFFRRAFGPQADIEALDKRYMGLIIRPGVCACGESEAA